MDWGKSYMTHDVMLPCLETEVNTSNIATYKSLLVHRTVDTMLAYLNYHKYIVFVVFFKPGVCLRESTLAYCKLLYTNL